MCLRLLRATKCMLCITAPIQGRSAPSVLHCSVHLTYSLSYETRPQHRIWVLGQKPGQRPCFHQHKLSEQEATATASPWPMPQDSHSDEKEFPYLFGWLQRMFLLHPLFASFCLSLGAASIIVMAIFTWLSSYTVFRFSRLFSGVPLPFLLPLLRL